MIRNDYIESFKKAGFTKEQAEVQISTFEDFMERKVATKEDLVRLELKFEKQFMDLRFEIKDIRSEMKDIRSEIKDIRSDIKDLRSEVNDIKLEFTRKSYHMVAMLGGIMAALGIVFKYVLP